MKSLEKTKNAKRNIFWGFVDKIVTIILPFINRTLMIYLLGDQYVGLGSLFKSILSVLNLAELGVGSALVYSMYEPIAKNDTPKICALMNLYRKCYRVIGGVVLVLGLSLLPILPKLIKGGYPSDINIYVLYLMYLMQTVLTYNLFAYKNCLLHAHQRTDVVSIVSLVIHAFTMISQAIVLLLFKNYYLYMLIGLASSLLNNIAVAIVVTKMYPNYKCAGTLDKESIAKIWRQVRGLVSTKIGGVVINSADNIVISAFLGLSVVGWYNNYFYFITSVIAFLNILLHSLTAGIGNSIVINSVEENKKIFDKLTFIYQWIVSWCTVCFVCLYQPVMKVWNPKGMFPFYIVCLLCFRFYAGRVVQMTFTYKDALGLWWEDRFRPLIAALANLIINIILVKIIGIAGVIISTFVCTIFINTPWGISILFKHYFKTGMKEHYLKLLLNCAITFIGSAGTLFVCSLIKLEGFALIILRGIICIIIPNLIFTLFYYKTADFKEAYRFIKKRL